MSEKRPARRLVWWAALFLPALVAVSFAIFQNLAARDEQALHKFMHPDAAEVREEFEYFTGHPLPETARVVLARRSRPSPLLGDHHGCALIALNAAELRALLRALPAGEDDLNQGMGCPDKHAFWRATEGMHITIRHLIRKAEDDFIIIATVNGHMLLVEWVYL